MFPAKDAFVAILFVIVVENEASLLIAAASSDNVFNKSGDELIWFEICVCTYDCDAILAPDNWNKLNNDKALILYWLPLYIKLIGVFDNRDKIFD